MSCEHDYRLIKTDTRGEGHGSIFEAGTFFCRYCLDIQRKRID